MIVNRHNLGIVLRQLGRFAEAQPHLVAALAHDRQSGSPQSEINVLDELSQLHVQFGEPTAALEAAYRARHRD